MTLFRLLPKAHVVCQAANGMSYLPPAGARCFAVVGPQRGRYRAAGPRAPGRGGGPGGQGELIHWVLD